MTDERPLPAIPDESSRLELLESQLATLCEVSSVLSRSLNLRETLQEVLRVLHERGRLSHGLVALLDEESGDLLTCALHQGRAAPLEPVRYGSGEGIIGRILERNETWILPRVGDEPRFLDRLNLYQPALPFIGVPIRIGEGGAVGVFAAQPPRADGLLPHRARFLEMVANLMGQAVRLARSVEAEQQALRDERDKLRREVKATHGFESIIGHTVPMRLVFDQVRQVAKWTTTVLIRGESGTGKELVANAIHYNSPRARGPFVKLNCAALPDSLLESELFGHEKGAFTGAISLRKGRFEQADGGSFFLDEIGEISPAFQAKLLRILQEGEFERVGGSRTLKVDVRFIAATNRDLESEVRAGDFREDLYYRLNVMPIRMPSLRERIEDLPDLARFLVDQGGQPPGPRIEDHRQRPAHPDAPRLARECAGAGELHGARGRHERGRHHRPGYHRTHGPRWGHPGRPASRRCRPAGGTGVGISPRIDLDDPDLDERERVIAAMEEAGWVQAKAARLLNMTPRQIAYRIQTLNIKVRQF